MSEFTLPDIGEGIVECEVVKWLVAEGDEIEEDQPVVEVMTDKALVEITAPESGRITTLHYAEGESARVHSALFSYHSDSQRDSNITETAVTSDAAAGDVGESTQTVANDSVVPADSPPDTPPATQHRTPASPAVRRLVRELALTVDEIPGSGKDGRVLKEDVLAWQAKHAEADSHEGSMAAGLDESIQKPRIDQGPRVDQEPRIEKLSGLQAAMARHMSEAVKVPHFHYGEEVDVTVLMALHEQLKEAAGISGQRVTLMALFMKSLALTLQDHPRLNASFQPEAGELRYHRYCHIGMAVDSPNGLLVPVVKHVERLTLLALAAEISRLTQAARDARVSPDDLKGATITLSNIGALGGTYAAPLITPPQVAIGAIGKVQHLPRFDAAGEVVSRAIMTITWAGDHRVLDGGGMARFCSAWKGYLEAPQSMLLHLG